MLFQDINRKSKFTKSKILVNVCVYTNASIQKQYCANAVETAKATIFSQSLLHLLLDIT